MVDPFLITAVGTLLKTLWDMIQNAKDKARVIDLEFQLLKAFIEQLKAFSEMFAFNSSTDIGTNLTQALVQAETKLQEWCSKKSGFLSRSSDEIYGELKVLRQSLETALDLEKLLMPVQLNKNVVSMLGKLIEQGQAENPPRKHPEPSSGLRKTAPSKGKPSASQVSTKIINNDQSKSRAVIADRGKPSKARIADSPRQLPSKAPPSSRPSSSADSTRNHSRVADGKKPSTSRPTKVDSAGNQSSNKDGKTHRQQPWQYLWVSMDSEFQAHEVKKDWKAFKASSRSFVTSQVRRCRCSYKKGAMFVPTLFLSTRGRQSRLNVDPRCGRIGQGEGSRSSGMGLTHPCE